MIEIIGIIFLGLLFLWIVLLHLFPRTCPKCGQRTGRPTEHGVEHRRLRASKKTCSECGAAIRGQAPHD